MRFDFAARLFTIVFASALPWAVHAAEAAKVPGAKADASSLARGKYLVTIGGCNDCHTAGYAMTNGKVPEKDWLAGDRLGWRGPWGTACAVTDCRQSGNRQERRIFPPPEVAAVEVLYNLFPVPDNKRIKSIDCLCGTKYA